MVDQTTNEPAEAAAGPVEPPAAAAAAETIVPVERAPLAADAVAPPLALAASPPGFVYALGQVDARFPTLAIEKEVAQVVSAPAYARLTEREAISAALADGANRYLARAMCWVLTIEGLETYVLVPRDAADLDLLVDAFRAQPSGEDLDLVIGVRGGLASPETCGGLTLPVVVVDQLYSFDRDGLVAELTPPAQASRRAADRFREVARSQLDQLAQLGDNAGATDEHRALNYLLVRYPRLYEVSAEKLDRNLAFSGVAVRPSALGPPRTVVEVVLAFTHRETDVVEKEFVRVDVTEQYPFLVTKLGPYYDR